MLVEQLDFDLIISMLDDADVVYKSDYMEVQEVAVGGRRYRKIVWYAGRGKMRAKLPNRYEVFEDGKWKLIKEVEVK